MHYYRCSLDDLRKELLRRGILQIGPREDLAEVLSADDDERQSIATAVVTQPLGQFVPSNLHMSRSSKFRKTVPAGSLVGEYITYWTMNSLFPSLQLFFKSGKSCTIECASNGSTMIGFDRHLRFRMTDSTFEEDGVLRKSLVPDKFAHAVPGIRIDEAIVAERTSIMIQLEDRLALLSGPPTGAIRHKKHKVIGLKLQGMQEMGFIWAGARLGPTLEDPIWGDVRIAGMRNDSPSPSLVLPLNGIKPGGELVLIHLQSSISRSQR